MACCPCCEEREKLISSLRELRNHFIQSPPHYPAYGNEEEYLNC